MGFAGVGDLCDLLKAGECDVIALQTPSGKEELEVMEIRYVALRLN